MERARRETFASPLPCRGSPPRWWVCFFAYHVLWPKGFGDAFDWVAGAIGLSGLLTLFLLKWGVIRVIFLNGALGLTLFAAGVTTAASS